LSGIAGLGYTAYKHHQRGRPPGSLTRAR